MVKRKTNTKGRWLIIAFMAIASLIFTGCDNGSLGLKSGSITGYILNVDTNQPVSEVLVTAKGTVSGGTENRSTYTTGDGSFVLADLKKGSWAINVEKFGFIIATDSAEIAHRTVEVNNGETVSAPVIKLHKTELLVRGVLKGYPVDAVTGRPLSKFTVTQATPYNQRKSKTFETAADF
ncbi:MAG: carboxypeptidase-like regulatory domain-containing protein, partial [Candidatus Riflebacteria bacterium]